MKKRVLRLLAVFLLLAAAALGTFLFVTVRGCRVEFTPELFSQSSRQLHNPDRGFYRIRAYTIQPTPQQFEEQEDTEQEEDAEQEEGTGQTDDGQVLELVQINLRKFRSGELSPTGLQNVEELFRFLEGRGKRYIVRFLYDWNGNASATEPETIDVILAHMRQLSPILKNHADSIFVLQGLFVGNWGEMNGTPFTNRESLERLAAELASDTERQTFLSVRTPAHWRKTVGGENFDPDDPIAVRLGLYNDGILGTSGDCGTYVGKAEDRANPFVSWNREDELAFQEELCKYVPNGGEVVIDNPLNDFESALDALRTMRVTYLNWDYDRSVLDKWAASVAQEPPYDGMDGLTYIQRHLGYRYWIESASFRYSYLGNRLLLGANLKNAGFAPMYSENQLTLTLVGRGERLTFPLDTDLRTLAGGNQWDDTLTAQASIPLTGLRETEYQVYLQVRAASQPLELANDQEPGEYGYYLGEFSFRRPAWYAAVFPETD